MNDHADQSLPPILAVIVHHRGRKLLERCLDRLLASQGVRLGIAIVLNDCRDPLPENARDEKRVRLVPSRRPLGFSEANNLGVRAGTEAFGEPEHVFFVNNDAFVEASTLADLARVLERHSDVGVVGPRLMIEGADDHLNSIGLNVTVDAEAWDEGIGRPFAEYGKLPELREVLAVTGAAILIRTSMLRRVGGWTPVYRFYMEDIDLCLKVRGRGARVLCATRTRMTHAISATAALGSDLKLVLTWRNRWLLLAIHWPLRELVRLLPGVLRSEFALWRRRRHYQHYREAALQAKAWRQAILALPVALWLRLRRRADHGWFRFLYPAGSVPPITLPDAAGKGVD